MNTRMRHRRMRRKKPKRFTRGMKFGLLWVLGVCFLLFCGLLYNICRYNWDKGDDYKKKVLAQQSYTNAVLDYRRGAIKDRNDTVLAQSIRKFNLIIEPRSLATKEDIKKKR